MDGIRSTAENSGKRSPVKGIIVFVICLAISFGMWLYVMSVESPEYRQVFSNLTVSLEDNGVLSENGLAIYSGYGTIVDLTLSGKKSIVSKLTNDDIFVSADLSGTTASGRYNCDIHVDVPSGCKLVEKSQDSVSVYVDSAGQITVPLYEKRENMSLPDDCMAGTVDLNIDNITVSGPQSMLSKIERAVVTLDMNGVKKSTLIEGRIDLLDANGNLISSPYVSYSPREIEVTVPVYKTVRVPIEVEFKNGFLNYDNSTVYIEPSYVDVTGDVEVIDRGDLVKPIVVDEKQSFESGRFMRVIALEAAEGVELSSEKVEVTIGIVNTYGTRALMVPGDRITAEGVNENVHFTWPSTDFEVTVLGRRSAISRITPDDIELVIDMSPYTPSNAGIIRVKADVRISDEFAKDVLPVGTYYLNVEFDD